MRLAIILAWLLNQRQWKKNSFNLVTKHTNMHIHGYVCEGKA
jgi:hypothetical protein